MYLVVLLKRTQALSHLLSFCGRPNWQKTLHTDISDFQINRYQKQTKTIIIFGQDRTFFSSTTVEGLATEGSSGGNPSRLLLSACHNREIK